MRYQVYLVSNSKGVEIRDVFAASEAEALNRIYEKVSEDTVVKSIRPVN